MTRGPPPEDLTNLPDATSTHPPTNASAGIISRHHASGRPRLPEAFNALCCLAPPRLAAALGVDLAALSATATVAVAVTAWLLALWLRLLPLSDGWYGRLHGLEALRPMHHL